MSLPGGLSRGDLEGSVRKNHEMVFEACKHFSTLDTAAALVSAAVFRETSAGVGGAVLPLLFFGLSLIACAVGMMATALRGLMDRNAERAAVYSLITGALTFFVGLTATVLKLLPG